LLDIIPFFFKPKSRGRSGHVDLTHRYIHQYIILEKINANNSYLKKKKKAIPAVGSSRKGGTRFVDNISVRYMSLAFMTMFKNK
jgi:hypothetical protein